MKLNTAISQKNEPRPFQLTGVFRTEASGYVYLSYSYQNRIFNDSSLIDHGKFSFSGKLPEPVYALVSNVSPGRQSNNYVGIELFIEPGKLRFTGEYKNKGLHTLSGSDSESDWVKLKQGDSASIRQSSLYYDSARLAYQQTKAADSVSKVILMNQVNYFVKTATTYDESIEKMDSIFHSPHSVLTNAKNGGLPANVSR